MTIKLQGVGEQGLTIRLYNCESIEEGKALRIILETRMKHKPLKVGDKIEAWKYYDTVSTYKVKNICMDNSVEIYAIWCIK